MENVRICRRWICVLSLGLAVPAYAGDAVQTQIQARTERAQERLERCAYQRMYFNMSYRYPTKDAAADIRNICKNQIEAYNIAKDDETHKRTGNEPIDLDAKPITAPDYAGIILKLLMEDYARSLKATRSLFREG